MEVDVDLNIIQEIRVIAIIYHFTISLKTLRHRIWTGFSLKTRLRPHSGSPKK